MPKYDVHLYAVVRVKVSGVEACSMENAIEKAEGATPLHQMFDRGDMEYAEEITHYLVDVEGDEEYMQTKWFWYDDDGNLRSDEA